MLAASASYDHFDWLELSPFWRTWAARERKSSDDLMEEELRHLPRILKQGLVRTLLSQVKQCFDQAGVTNKRVAGRLGVSGAAVSQWFNPPIEPRSGNNSSIDAANLASLLNQPECRQEVAKMIESPWDLPIGQCRHGLQWVQGTMFPEYAGTPVRRVDFEVLFHVHLGNSAKPSVPHAMFELFPQLSQQEVEAILATWGEAYRLLVVELTRGKTKQRGTDNV